jgi:hypothetical protein
MIHRKIMYEPIFSCKINRLNAFEMWIWRKIEKVSWSDHKTNAEVLKSVEERTCLVDTIVKRKKMWIGHVLREGGLLIDVMEGRMEGKRPWVRRRMGMIDELKQSSYGDMKRRAENRVKWSSWLPWTCHHDRPAINDITEIIFGIIPCCRSPEPPLL